MFSIPSKLNEEPVVSEPKSNATKKLKKVATTENIIANTNFTDTNSLRVHPSIIFWRWVLKLNSFVSNIIKSIPGKIQ